MSAGAGNPAVESLAAAALAFLRRYPPFDEMEERPLRYLASHLAVAYHPKGAAILRPEDGEPQYFYIIRSGRVHVTPAETYHLSPGADLALGPGEYFSVGALVEHRPVGSAYTAAEDTFCLQLPAAAFRELLHRSPRFQEFSTRYLAALLRESRRLLSMHRASLAAEQQAMGRALRSLIHRSPVTCLPDATVGEALRTMKSAEVGSIIITAPDGSPAGIFTQHDVFDRVATAGRGLDDPISAVMTPSPRALPADANAYDAALLIARHGIRHVPVLDGRKVIGVVTERDLFALQRVGIRAIHPARSRMRRRPASSSRPRGTSGR
jgi:CBS domain-containing protein